MRIGLTKARSMGPVAEAVEQAGGSVARVFRRADVPLRIVDEPDRLILLRDQLRLVESAAREIGDVALPARLSLGAGVASLGPYGVRVCASARLDEALVLGTTLITDHLQTATRLDLVVEGRRARVTYAVTEDSDVGRQKNEVLAIGYILDVLRRFAGPRFVPDRASVTGPVLQARGEIEGALGCALALAGRAAVHFDADLLATPNPGAVASGLPAASEVPDPADLEACAGELILTGLLDRRPPIDWLCARLGVSRRTLQRRFEEHGTTFGALLRTTLEREAKRRLADPRRPIAGIALDLGYADPAHFTRAFRGWTGLPPRAWRRLATGRHGPE